MDENDFYREHNLYYVDHTQLTDKAIFQPGGVLDGFRLLSIYGFKVGSLVRLAPSLMERYRRHDFSPQFKSLYKSGVFSVSHHQTDLLFPSLKMNNDVLSIDIEIFHIQEFMAFVFKNKDLIPDRGWDTNPLFAALTAFCFEPYMSFPSLPTTQHPIP